jgi:hypothetical protein
VEKPIATEGQVIITIAVQGFYLKSDLLKQEKIFCEHTPWYFHSDQPGNINTTHTT